MRLLGLYLRSRRIPAAAGAAAGIAAALWVLGRHLGDPQATLALTALATAVAAALAGPGLAGPDPDLERTAALRWPAWRTGHVLAAVAALTAVLAPFTGVAVVVRDVGGLVGLTALGAATIGAARAWIPPLAWAAPVAMGAAAGDTWHAQLLTWMIRPAESTTAAMTAAALLAAGAVSYAAAGGRR